MSPHFTTKDMEERLKCDARTLERWRTDGTGPKFLKAGRRVLYPLHEVERWEAERTHASRAAAMAAQGRQAA